MSILNHKWTPLSPCHKTMPVQISTVVWTLWPRPASSVQLAKWQGLWYLLHHSRNSIPENIYTRILLAWALPTIRSKRRPQQARFIPNRSTTDQIPAPLSHYCGGTWVPPGWTSLYCLSWSQGSIRHCWSRIPLEDPCHPQSPKKANQSTAEWDRNA